MCTIIIAHTFTCLCPSVKTIVCIVNACYIPVGHGKSEGQRAQVQRFDDYVEDLLLHVAIVQTSYRGIPTFLLGHSVVRDMSSSYSARIISRGSGALISNSESTLQSESVIHN